MRIAAITLAIVFLTLVQTAHAHEFWIQPDHDSLRPGQLLTARLFHGERFDGTPVPRDSRHIRRFRVQSESARADLEGLDGASRSFARLDQPGTHVVSYLSNPVTQTLEPKAFEEYLAEEGLDHVIRQRRRLGESSLPGRERYVRCAKAIVEVDAETRERDRADDLHVGLPLEIVLIDRSDSTISARVTRDAVPVPGACVVAVHRDDPARLLEAQTDDGGVVRFAIESRGTWMLTTIAMERDLDDPDTDWISFWSSTTFRVE